MAQIGFYFDQTRCTGCYTCVVACKDWHDIPAGPVSWCRISTTEEGTYPKVFLSFLITHCFHCEEPACAEVCPTNCITKRSEDGVVMVNQSECLGKDSCGQCRLACTYEVPQFRNEPDSKMEKCDSCADRLAEGKPPICVAACPMRALDFGTMDELRKKYGANVVAHSFRYNTKLKPGVVMKGKKR